MSIPPTEGQGNSWGRGWGSKSQLWGSWRKGGGGGGGDKANKFPEHSMVEQNATNGKDLPVLRVLQLDIGSAGLVWESLIVFVVTHQLIALSPPHILISAVQCQQLADEINKSYTVAPHHTQPYHWKSFMFDWVQLLYYNFINKCLMCILHDCTVVVLWSWRLQCAVLSLQPLTQGAHARTPSGDRRLRKDLRVQGRDVR